MSRTATHLSSSSPWILALALTGALAAPTPAQEAKPESDSHIGQTVTVKFRGGSLADYVSVIRNAGDKINVVLPPMASEVRVPPLSIVDAEVDTALDVAAEIAEPTHRVQVKTHRPKWGRPVYVIMVREMGSSSSAGANAAVQGPMTVVRVFSLRPLTERLPGDPDHSDYRVKAETVLTAIEAGFAVGPSEEPVRTSEGVVAVKSEDPVLRYHKDSGLLFVRGTLQQTGMVKEVLERMIEDVERSRVARLRAGPGSSKGGDSDQPRSSK